MNLIAAMLFITQVGAQTENRVVVKPITVRVPPAYSEMDLLPGTPVRVFREGEGVVYARVSIGSHAHDGVSTVVIPDDQVPPRVSVVNGAVEAFAERINDESQRILFRSRMSFGDKERKELLEFVKRSPDSRDLVEFALQSKAPIQWRRQVLSALEHPSWRSRLPVLQAMLSVEEADFAAAREQFENGKRVDELTWSERVLYGISLYELGEIERAKSIFRDVVGEMELRVRRRPIEDSDYDFRQQIQRLVDVRALADASIGIARCSFRLQSSRDEVVGQYNRAIGVCQASKGLQFLAAEAELELTWVEGVSGSLIDVDDRFSRVLRLRGNLITDVDLLPIRKMLDAGEILGDGDVSSASELLTGVMNQYPEYADSVKTLLMMAAKEGKFGFFPWHNSKRKRRWNGTHRVLRSSHIFDEADPIEVPQD